MARTGNQSLARRPTVWGILRALPVFLLLAVALILLQLDALLAWMVRAASRRVATRMQRYGAFAWTAIAVVGARWVHGASVQVTGDELPAGENAVLVCNHLQMADILVIYDWAYRHRRNGDLRFYTKSIIRQVPVFGWTMALLGFPFVRRNWTRDRASIERVFGKITRARQPIWLAMFPEGTRSTPEKIAASRAYAEEHGLHRPSHTLVPRSKGFVAALHGLVGQLDAVYDLTVAYPDGIPSLWQWSAGAARRAHLHVRRTSLQELPPDDEGRRQWLMQRFVEKDERLASFLETGELASHAGRAPAAAASTGEDSV